MNTPAQIFTALAAVGAAAVLPLGGLFQEADSLRTAAQKRASLEKARTQSSGSAADSQAAAGKVDAAAAASLRIPPAVSAATASSIIAELAALDGKMMSSRQIIALMDKVMSLPASHLEEARAAIEKSKNPVMGGFLYSALFSRWGELDPEGAHVALESNSGPGANPIFKFAGAASLAGGWMEKDPDGFLKWINEDKAGLSESDKELRRNMMNGVLAGMANIDSATAEKLIAAAPKDRRAWMIMDMAEHDPSIDPRDAAARALAEAGDDEGQRNSVQWRIGRMLADRDPQEAIKWAEEQKPEDMLRILGYI